MAMNNPPHLGGLVRDCIEGANLTVTAAALALGVTRQTLNSVVNEKASVSPEMAIRLEKMGWSNAEHWLRMQTAYNLAQARARESEIIVNAPAS